MNDTHLLHDFSFNQVSRFRAAAHFPRFVVVSLLYADGVIGASPIDCQIDGRWTYYTNAESKGHNNQTHLYAKGEEHEDNHHKRRPRDRGHVPLQVRAHGVQVNVLVEVPDIPTPTQVPGHDDTSRKKIVRREQDVCVKTTVSKQIPGTRH